VITQSSDAMVSMERRADDRLKTQVQIIHASANIPDSTVVVWVKNVGSVRILAPDSSDLFFGPQGDFVRLPYGVGTPSWQYVVENGTEWNPTTTIRITISGYALTSGRYFMKLVLTNGISAESYFSW
jgi:archaellum component FlaG (FlaF/FlaG flagellin family)